MKVCVVCTNYNDTKELYIKHKDDSEVLFELRIDFSSELIMLLDLIPSNRIVLTLRSVEEGGKQSDVTIEELFGYTVEYLDLEMVRDKLIVSNIISGKLKVAARNIIISYHDFHNLYGDAFEIFESTLDSIWNKIPYNFVVKFVGFPNDTYEMIQLLNEKKNKYPRHIFLGSNIIGDILRTQADFFSQEFVFGSTGNLDIINYEILLSINENKPFFKLGLIGKGIQFSLSPKIHKIFLKQSHLNGYYHILDISSPRYIIPLLSFLKTISVNGFNITSPYKLDVLKQMNDTDESAIITNSANVGKLDGDNLTGFNTDKTGFMIAYQQILDNEFEVLVLGASGAARSAAVSCLGLGKKVTNVMRSSNRKLEYPTELIEKLTIVDSIPEVFNGVLINCTQIGKGKNDEIIIPDGIISVIDINYYEGENKWLTKCNQKGIEYVDGKVMLFHQAVDAFKIWTNIDVDRDSALREYLEVSN